MVFCGLFIGNKLIELNRLFSLIGSSSSVLSISSSSARTFFGGKVVVVVVVLRRRDDFVEFNGRFGFRFVLQLYLSNKYRHVQCLDVLNSFLSNMNVAAV